MVLSSILVPHILVGLQGVGRSYTYMVVSLLLCRIALHEETELAHMAFDKRLKNHDCRPNPAHYEIRML